MADHIDPQVTSSLISTVGGALFGGGGVGLVARWVGKNRRTEQDQRCERVCNSMLGLGQTLIAVIKALGLDAPNLSPHIHAMEAQMAEARAMLNEGSEA